MHNGRAVGLDTFVDLLALQCPSCPSIYSHAFTCVQYTACNTTGQAHQSPGKWFPGRDRHLFARSVHSTMRQTAMEANANLASHDWHK